MSVTDPLVAAAQAALSAHDPDGIVGLAVSGGSDSIAMLHLFAQVAPDRLQVVTVDHRLRAEAADEAAFVAGICAGYGIPHDTLIWGDHPATGNLMQAARKARYGLMAEWARQHGIAAIAVAHTTDDQAETFLMALSRKAGVEGLSAMRPRWEQDGATFFRPLLDKSRQELRDWLGKQGLGWRDDPSNEDDKYLRVRARRALTALRPLGIDAQGLAATARNLAALRDWTVRATAQALDQVGDEVAGALVLRRAEFARLDPQIARQLMTAALHWMSAADHPPRATAMARLLDAAAAGRDATLAGCRLRGTQTAIRLVREPRAIARNPVGLWDGRWRVEGPEQAVEIRALGPEGLRACADWRATGLPRDVLIVTPAVWDGPRLIAAPMAGMGHGWTARIDRSLRDFILSH